MNFAQLLAQKKKKKKKGGYGSTVPAALAVLVVTFAMIRLVPGDPVQVIAGTNLDPQVAADLRDQLGLQRPDTGPVLRLSAQRSAG